MSHGGVKALSNSTKSMQLVYTWLVTFNKVNGDHIKHELTYLDHNNLQHFSNLAPVIGITYSFKRSTKVSIQAPAGKTS